MFGCNIGERISVVHWIVKCFVHRPEKWTISCFPLATISWIVLQIGNRFAPNVLGLLFSLASIWFNVAHTSASLCELFVLIELGDRFGLSRRARRLHKSRGTVEYFGSSIANGSMAEDGTKIPRSRSPEAGCWSTNLNLHGEYGHGGLTARGSGYRGARFQSPDFSPPQAKNFFEERILRKFWLKIDENRWFQATLTSKMEDPKKYQSTRMRSFIRFVIQKVGCRNFFVSKSKKN